ncbi:hypothetical protein [Mesorhizobium tamadayense]|uniref:hypothetical protein n=1 Tax=Mesorhizobium tamadayense TaxID=425306 RepID=UPI001FDF9D64|nr:hypothetical protein [Mesorhizobium tamadayense]
MADAPAGAYGVVNAVSLYVEQGRETFHSVHVESARRVAAQAHRAGVERLVHVSGIGSDVPRRRSTFASVATANCRRVPRLLTPPSSARR